MVTGHSGGVAAAALPHPALAGIHFTGSTGTFHTIWSTVSANLDSYRTYPRLVGETGGKDFVVAHRSASPDALLVGLLRGAFEYQGQKCSAASRAYVPRAMWEELRGPLAAATESMPMGDPTDMRNFMGAVIDEGAFRTHETAITAARDDPTITLVAGGECDDSEGWFVRPTIFETADPHHDLMERELFGPILTVHPYAEDDWETVLRTVDGTSPYALTGAVFATDRGAIDVATRVAAQRGRQLLHQRQTHRRGGRPAAVRGRAQQRHQRQGRLAAQPAALGLRASDQGDVQPADGLALPAPGARVAPAPRAAATVLPSQPAPSSELRPLRRPRPGAAATGRPTSAARQRRARP